MMVTIPYDLPDDGTSATRSTTALSKLREGLLGGHYLPGQHLGENELARALGVSRTPVREALRTLEQEGLVDYAPNRGYVVRSCTFEDVVAAFLVRQTLEGLAARLAARQGVTLEQRVRMAVAIEQAFELVESGRWRGNYHEWTQVNSSFHCTILESTQNRPLARAVNNVLRLPIVASDGQAATFSHRDLMRWFDDSTMLMSCKEHVEILEAIVRRDEDQAAKAMEGHVARASAVIQNGRQMLEGRWV